MNPTTEIKKVSQSYEHSEFDSVVNIHYGRNKEKKMITSINNDHDEDFAHIYGYC